MEANKKIAATGLIFVVMAAVGFLFVVGPLLADIKESKARVVAAREKAGDQEARVANAREFIEFSRREIGGLEAAQAAFADGAMPLAIINWLEQAARDSGVKIEFLPAGEVNSNNEWPAIKMEMNATGNLEAVLRLADKIENSRYLMEIQSFDLELEKTMSGVSPAGQRKAAARILLKIYAKLQS